MKKIIGFLVFIILFVTLIVSSNEKDKLNFIHRDFKVFKMLLLLSSIKIK